MVGSLSRRLRSSAAVALSAPASLADRPDAFVGCLQGHPGRRGRCEFMTTTSAKATKPVAPLSVPELPADLDAGLRRLELAAIRRTAPEVLQTAKTQRWTPEEVPTP